MAEASAIEKQVNRGVAWAAAAQAVIAVADLVSYMVVVAVLVTNEDLGVAMSAMGFYTLLEYAADFGVTSAIIQRDDHTPERISTVFWFNMLVSVAILLVLCVVGPLYGWFQGDFTIGWLLIAYGGKIVFQNVYSIPFALLRKELRYADVGKARMAAHLAESAARIGFAAAGITIWCWTLGAFVRAFVFGVIMQIRHPFVPKLVFKPREVMPYIKFGLRTAASQVLYQLYTNIDYAVVFKVFGERANGIYAFAYFIVLEPVKTIANVVIDVAYPTFARLKDDRVALIRQFIMFTRLNLIVVLPFVVLILLIIPEFLHTFFAYGKWSYDELEVCADCARILCLVGVLRALGFVGPPLLDGIGRPDLTLRYMVSATIVVPTMFVIGALVLGPLFSPERGMMSVAVAWAIGYPLAFAVLGYIIVNTIELPVREYLRQSWGMIGCCAAGGVAGFGVSLALTGAGSLLRVLAISGTTLAVIVTLVVTWQKITPKSIKAALSG